MAGKSDIASVSAAGLGKRPNEPAETCRHLHEIARKGRRFSWPFEKADILHSGIYLMFESGEVGHGGDRIVRVGTHKGATLGKRLWNHFGKERRGSSILQLHIGRCLLSKAPMQALEFWDTKRPIRQADIECSGLDVLSGLEAKTLNRLRSTFTFALVEVTEQAKRIRLEEGLISVLAQCPHCRPSPAWLGQNHPKQAFGKNGLWNAQGLRGTPLEISDIDRSIRQFIVR